uniref:Regulatory protein zeste n=1 Tax=Glossina pallidipes TaxID=7398 RepID=A0A1B0AAN9_GLOPL
MSSEAAENSQHRMDRRKKRTSTNQYILYIEMMEKDAVFASGRIPRDYDPNYLHRKWKELSDKLNSCSNGPTLTAEEWRKRLNDWKNTTRCKYRRSVSGEKDISMTSLELRALELFGKSPSSSAPPEQVTIHFKSEKDDEDMEHISTTETFQKQLQAAVEEAIGGDEDAEHLVEAEQEEAEEILPEAQNTSVISSTGAGGDTIVVEETTYHEDDVKGDEHLEFITQRRPTIVSSSTANPLQTVVTSAPTATVTKLINGDIPLKRLRSQISDQIIYEVTAPTIQHHHQQAQPISITQAQQHIGQELTAAGTTVIATSQDMREVARQLKRLADIKAEKLKFEIEQFKFRNPGFNYSFNPL